MTGMEYQQWLTKAFLYVEAALGQELATPSRVCMTEDYFRASLVRGLAASQPSDASRITTEEDAPWANAPCWHNAAHVPGQGRPIQHDVAIRPGDGDSGLFCEVKWLKTAQAVAVAKDIWKLALSRSTAQESQAPRTYLLVGGEAGPMSDTFGTLRLHRVDVRWSNAGRQSGGPAARDVPLDAFLQSSLGQQAVTSLLRWGSDRHHRTPPDCWATLRLARRTAPWRRTIEGIGWRAVLFELHHYGVANGGTITWAPFCDALTFGC